jgi:hypothetical protein
LRFSVAVLEGIIQAETVKLTSVNRRLIPFLEVDVKADTCPNSLLHLHFMYTSLASLRSNDTAFTTSYTWFSANYHTATVKDIIPLVAANNTSLFPQT